VQACGGDLQGSFYKALPFYIRKIHAVAWLIFPAYRLNDEVRRMA